MLDGQLGVVFRLARLLFVLDVECITAIVAARKVVPISAYTVDGQRLDDDALVAEGIDHTARVR